MEKKGVFISLEGPDGAGKTTHFNFITQALQERGFNVITTRQPGGSPTAEVIRKAVLGTPLEEPMDYVVEAMLYAASRRQVLKAVIEPALANGSVVLSDRWADSSYAYQGWGRGVLKEYLAIRDIAHKDFWPDYTIFFDITHEESLRRLSLRNKEFNRLNQEEDEAFRKRCYDGYQSTITEMADRFVVVDGMRDVASIRESIHRWLDRDFVPKHRHLQHYPR